MSKLWRGLTAGLMLIGLVAFGPLNTTLAAGVVGDGTADSCTEAALDTALSGGGSVTFDCGTDAVTITVTSEKTLANNTQIDGGGLVTLSGGNATGILTVTSSAFLFLQNITLQNGSSANGGALYNSGNVEITNVTFTNNAATGLGGAIYNQGALDINNSTLSGNTATLQGGAVYNTNGGALSITSSTFNNNSGYEYEGGAIYSASGGEIDISDSTFSNNFGNGNGGALYSTGDDSVTVSDSTFSKNEGVGGAGGIYSDGTLIVTGSTFKTNYGDSGSAIQQGAGTLLVVDGTFTNNTTSETGSGNGGTIYVNSATAVVASTTFNSNYNYRGGALYNNAGTLTVLNSTLSSNDVARDGGAVYNRGTTKLINVSIHNSTNQADAGVGAGIYNASGMLEITASDIYSNSSAGVGGGLYSAGGATIITASTLSENSGDQGGGVYNQGGSVTLIDSTVDGSFAAGWAGGIYNNDTMMLASTVVSNNQADQGSGIYHNAGTLTVIDSLIFGNGGSVQGGALYVKSGTVNVTSSTLTDNFNVSGGAVYIADGALTILSSTLSGNTGGTDAGAIDAAGGTTTLTSSIVSGNTVQTASSVINCELNGGTVTSGGYNLSDDATCGFSATGDIQSSSNVSLGALADNGGATQTMQPDTGSATIDAADCSVTASTDQRGVTRSTSGATCDIGAVEVDGLVPVKLITAYNDTGPIAEGASATINAVATGPAGISYDYSFDCDTNGDYEDSDNGTGTSGTGTCTLESDGIFHVDIEVCDAADSSNCDTGLASVTVTNVAPVVSSPTVTPSSTTQSARTLTGAMDNTPSASDEGTSVVASATFYDPGIPDFHTCTVDYGDGSGPQPGTVIVDDEGDIDTCIGPHHIYVDDNPSGTSRDPYVVTVEVIDDAGDTGDNYTVHYVDNVPPTIDTIETDSSGDSVSITVEASDVGIEDVLTYSFDCDNDGSYETEGTDNQGICSNDAATIGVHVMDDDLGEATGTVEVDGQPTDTDLCVNYLTRVVSAMGADGCGRDTQALILPASGSSSFCISPGLGKLRWSFDGQCPAGQQLHVLPDDGPIDYCRTPYLGLLRVPAMPGQCSDYEIAGQLSG